MFRVPGDGPSLSTTDAPPRSQSLSPFISTSSSSSMTKHAKNVPLAPEFGLSLAYRPRLSLSMRKQRPLNHKPDLMAHEEHVELVMPECVSMIVLEYVLSTSVLALGTEPSTYEIRSVHEIQETANMRKEILELLRHST